MNMIKESIFWLLIVVVIFAAFSTSEHHEQVEQLPTEALPSVGLCKQAARVMNHTKGHSRDTIRRAEALVNKCKELGNEKGNISF